MAEEEVMNRHATFQVAGRVSFVSLFFFNRNSGTVSILIPQLYSNNHVANKEYS